MFKLFNILNSKIDKYNIDKNVKNFASRLGTSCLNNSYINEIKKLDKEILSFNINYFKKITGTFINENN